VKQPPDAPFYGLTQQFSGVPKCRVFLPTDVPDENGYYTRCMQYIDDAPGGGFIWSWYWVAGHEYAPVLPADGGENGGTPTPPPSGLTEAQVQAMIDTSIAAALTNVVHYDEKIALVSSGDESAGVPASLLCAEAGGPADEGDEFLLTSRNGAGDPGPWESWTLRRGQ
jgi:hypothetical protein